MPQAITGLFSLFFSLLGFLAGEQGTIPLALFLLLFVQIVGFAVTRREEPAALRWSWVVSLVATSVGLPLLAIQVTLARQPYTGTEWDSALPLVSASAAVALLLTITAIALAFSSHEIPEEAGLLLMPMALLIPAAIGIRAGITEANAMQALGLSGLVAAAATTLAWSLPRPSRLLVPPVALATQFVLLWMMGRGPSFHSSSGAVVPLTHGGLLALTVILVVGTPILALWARGVTTVAEARARERGLPEFDALR
ncbi:MAG: hypothetical protein ACRDJH_08040 [Thermomicrobiales bacterium]